MYGDKFVLVNVDYLTSDPPSLPSPLSSPHRQLQSYHSTLNCPNPPPLRPVFLVPAARSVLPESLVDLNTVNLISLHRTFDSAMFANKVDSPVSYLTYIALASASFYCLYVLTINVCV